MIFWLDAQLPPQLTNARLRAVFENTFADALALRSKNPRPAETGRGFMLGGERFRRLG